MTEPTTARPPIGLAIGSLLRADSIVLLRNRISTFISILLPIVILVATTFAKRQTQLGGAAAVVALAVSLGLLTSGLLGYTLSLAHDRDVGVLQRLRVSPAPTWTILSSRLVVQVIAALVGSAIVLVVGAILHGLTLDAGQYAAALAISCLGAAVFLSMGQALVAVVPSTTAVSAIGRILFIILVLLGLVGGSGILGDTLKSIAGWSPVGALMTLLTDVLSGTSWSDQDTYALLACAAYILVFTVIGIRWFRWETR